jgi:hypothetical protein
VDDDSTDAPEREANENDSDEGGGEPDESADRDAA